MMQAYHLTGTGALLDILSELFLLLLELGAFTIEFSLRLLQSPLMFPQSLCWRLGPAKQRVNDVHVGRIGSVELSAAVRTDGCGNVSELSWAVEAGDRVCPLLRGRVAETKRGNEFLDGQSRDGGCSDRWW